MSKEANRQRRREDIRRRAASQTDTYFATCRIMDCRNESRAKAGQGLDQRYCRKHADHFSRHGDAMKSSYPASLVNPYRRASFDWLTENMGNRWVANAIDRINHLYQSSGPHVEAFRLRGLDPRARANAAWARLRKAEIDARLPIAAWLAIEVVVDDDIQPATYRGGFEFRRVQAAKIVHRIVSGSHKVWERHDAPSSQPRFPDQQRKRPVELHAYPQSRGRVLRYIGKDLKEAVEWLVGYHFKDVKAYKAEREAAGNLPSRPHPGRGVGVRARATGEVAPRQRPAAKPGTEVELTSSERVNRGTGTVRRDF